MADHSSVAFGAGHDPSATVVRAGDVIGIPPAIQEEHHLPAAIKGAFDGAAEAGADQPDPGVIQISALLGEVHNLDLRKRQPGGSLGQAMDGASGSSGRVMPALEGRRCRAEDDRAVRELSAANGDVPSLIPRRLVLFVGRIMFFIDDDEAELAIRNRGKNRRSGSKDDIGLSISNPAPLAMPLRGREAGMKDRRRGTWESREHAGGRLGREGDLRNENEHGPTGVEGLSGEAKVDLGLSAPRHAEEEVARKSSAEGFSDRFDRGGLCGIQLDLAIFDSSSGSCSGFHGRDGLEFEEAEVGKSLEDRRAANAGAFGEVVGGDRQFGGRRGEDGVVDRLLFLAKPGQRVRDDYGGLDEESLGRPDPLPDGCGHDIREGDSDRAGVIGGNPGGEVEQFGRKWWEVVSPLDDRLDPAWIEAIRNDGGRSDSLDDRSGDRGIPPSERDKDTVPNQDVLAGLRQRIEEPSGIPIDRAFHRNADELAGDQWRCEEIAHAASVRLVFPSTRMIGVCG